MKSPWTTKKLREICEEIKREKAPVGTIPYVEIGNVDVNTKKVIFSEKGAVKGSIFAPKNSILISRVRPTRGAVTFIDKKTAISSAFTIIKTKPEYNPKMVFYFLAWNKKFFDYLGERQKGTNYPSVKEKDILEFEILLPESKEEQQKIVKILDTIQSAVEIQEKIIEKTKELKKSLMNLLFHYGLAGLRVKELASSRVGELTSSEIEKLGLKLKKTEIGEIPEDWEVVRLGEIVRLSNGIRPEFNEGGVFPVYGANGIMGKSNKFLIDNEYTLIIGRVGASGEIHLASGKIWISDNALYSSEVEKEKVYLPFLKDYLIWRNLKQFADRSTHPIITQTFLKNFKLPLPPLPEQQEITEILQTIDQKIEIEKRKKELYEELFKTMLNKIMSQEIDINLLDY
jgi:type I restriction enzyme S subunit